LLGKEKKGFAWFELLQVVVRFDLPLPLCFDYYYDRLMSLLECSTFRVGVVKAQKQDGFHLEIAPLTSLPSLRLELHSSSQHLGETFAGKLGMGSRLFLLRKPQFEALRQNPNSQALFCWELSEAVRWTASRFVSFAQQIVFYQSVTQSHLRDSSFKQGTN